MQYKLFFPHISSNIPNFVINVDENLLFYNGIALIGESLIEIQIMQKLMGSRLFWYYITRSSKPYGSGYYSLSRNYIKRIGIPEFSEDEINFILNENDKSNLDLFFENIYGVNID